MVKHNTYDCSKAGTLPHPNPHPFPGSKEKTASELVVYAQSICNENIRYSTYSKHLLQKIMSFPHAVPPEMRKYVCADHLSHRSAELGETLKAKVVPFEY